jgi:hypothetical protein
MQCLSEGTRLVYSVAEGWYVQTRLVVGGGAVDQRSTVYVSCISRVSRVEAGIPDLRARHVGTTGSKASLGPQHSLNSDGLL